MQAPVFSVQKTFFQALRVSDREAVRAIEGGESHHHPTEELTELLGPVLGVVIDQPFSKHDRMRDGQVVLESTMDGLDELPQFDVEAPVGTTDRIPGPAP